jgi:site-specific DNA-methyltransferase (adenine-specific)
MVKSDENKALIDLYKGDCLIESDKIEDGSVDLILTDLPYGNMKNAPTTWDKTKTEWDTAIEPNSIYKIANRVLRKNGKMILFSQEPYTSRLINESIPNIPFNYRATWEKDNFANALGVNVNMVSFTEDILIFSKTHDMEQLHPLRDYFKIVMEYIGLNPKQINNKLGHRRAEHTFYVNSTQYALCTEKTYLELIDVFNIDKAIEFKNFAELSKINSTFNSTFNLWEGNKYKSNILKYKKDYTGHHPTQKPILLLEDLIKTFSNENDLVVDLTMGSGSCGVAAKNLNRKFIGIEMDENYFNIAKKRIEDA